MIPGEMRPSQVFKKLFVDGTPNWIKADDMLAFEVPTTD